MLRLLLVAFTATACSPYRGTARAVSPTTLAAEPGWIVLRDVPYIEQEGESECGAAAIAMVVSYWTKSTPASIVAAFRPVPKRGLAAARLRDYARTRGLASFVIQGSFEDLQRELEAGRPVLVGLTKPIADTEVLDHYEVVVGLHRERRLIVTLDPSEAWQQNAFDGFATEWKGAHFTTIVVSAKPDQR
jgi:ABC-type bacteriocin/lantibiotic exporter with double-glycine peptidase domain